MIANLMALMLRLLLLCRSLLPGFLWRWLWERHWREFWREQRTAARKKAGRDVPTPYWGSETATLVAEIAASYPFTSVLEFKSGRGDNLRVPARQFRRAKFLGLEANLDLIQEGNKYLLTNRIKNVELLAGGTAELSGFPANKFDLVFSCGGLSRIGPESIEQVLYELSRVAGKRLVILDQNESGAQCERARYGRFELRPLDRIGYWIWDYQELFKLVCPSLEVEISAVEAPNWTTEHWRTHGCLLTVQTGAS